MAQHIDEKAGIRVSGHVKISDPDTGEVIIDQHNAINFENFSIALASSISNKGQNFIYEMDFGNGGSSVDTTGIITYLPTNTIGQNANLYNPTYSKIVDNTAIANPDPLNNSMVASSERTSHVSRISSGPPARTPKAATNAARTTLRPPQRQASSASHITQGMRA